MRCVASRPAAAGSKAGTTAPSARKLAGVFGPPARTLYKVLSTRGRLINICSGTQGGSNGERW